MLPPQRTWLDRIGKQLEQEIIVNRDALDAGQFKQMGGFTPLDKPIICLDSQEN